jgi:hypothetical protein
MALRAPFLWLLAGSLLAGTQTLPGKSTETEPDPLPPFPQLFELIRTNLAGETDASLNRSAVQGLLRELSPRVSVVEAGADPLPSPTNLVQDATLLRGRVAYLRVGTVHRGLAGALREEFDRLSRSNGLNGLVLDLRFASGEDYPAAVDVADLFLEQEVPLINWGEGLKRSKDKDNAITLPMAVLINRETAAAAEALAGMLRQTGAGLLFGSPSSGTAGVAREFPFAEGERLRIVVSQVQLGDARRIDTDGLKPDVEVLIDLERERALLADPLSAGMTAGPPLASTSTNSGRFRVDEADLVRRWRGEALTREDLAKPTRTMGPESRDPVLVRALDLMEGLAILRQGGTR